MVAIVKLKKLAGSSIRVNANMDQTACLSTSAVSVVNTVMEKVSVKRKIMEMEGEIHHQKNHKKQTNS